MTTVDSLVRARTGDQRPALLFEDQSWTYDEYVRACAVRAAVLNDLLPADRPPHVGVLLDNVPEFAFWLGAAALTGSVVVGLNPTRRGGELAADVRHTDCQLIVTEPAHTALLDGLDLGDAAGRILDVESPSYAAAITSYDGTPLPERSAQESDLYLLIFTSGTSGKPKAVRISQGRLAAMSAGLVMIMQLTADDVVYAAMPMFHSNMLIAGWCPALSVGATVAMRRRFSASQFLPDVRRYGVTYFNYVGKPLSYILATPEQPDDADNPLRRVFGNEGAERDLARFAKRFGCAVTDNYGSTEGGVSVRRAPDQPPGALGKADEGICVLDPETGAECPPARFDEHGQLVNADEAIGELVNRANTGGFEGYYGDPDAEAARTKGGSYWTGDLAYRDADGWLYFAGRGYDWLRVDGENFAAEPVARILMRHPSVVLAVVYAVPDIDVGDQVMAAVQPSPDTTFDPAEFADFLSQQQDLGTKWAPRYVRICSELPTTQTSKVLVRQLRDEAWRCADPVWWRPGKELRYEPLDNDTAQGLSERANVRDETPLQR